MAQGDVVFFEQTLLSLGQEGHNFSSDTLKFGLIDDNVTPTAATAVPAWGAGGTTNLSSDQVTPGGNYSTGGPTIGSTTWTLGSNVVTLDGADVEISQDASNPTDARWGIIWNDSNAIDAAVGFVDLGGNTDLTAGDFSVSWNASGIAVLSRA